MRSRALKVFKRLSLTAAWLVGRWQKFPIRVYPAHGEGIGKIHIPIRIISLTCAPLSENDTLGLASMLQVHQGINGLSFVIQRNYRNIRLVVALKRNHAYEPSVLLIPLVKNGFGTLSRRGQRRIDGSDQLL